jgi:RNA polymerase sigma factor (sigma-70 family)
MDAAQRRELQEAMARLAEGDRTAFHPVFETAWPMVRAFARTALGLTADAEDAAQQALLKIFERASEFDRGREALPWILGVVANECRTIRRRTGRRREEPLEGALEPLALGPSPEEGAVTKDLERALRQVLGSLPKADVETLLLALGEAGGQASPVPASTFRKRLERARKRLRAAWSARHGAF